MEFRSSALPRRLPWRWVALLVVLLLAGGILLLRGSGNARGRLAAIRAQGYPVSVEDIASALGTNAARARQNVEQLDAFALAIRIDADRRPPRGRTNAASELEWARAQLTPENLAQFDTLHSHLRQGPWLVDEPTKGLMRLSSIPFGKARALATALQVEALSAAILEDNQRAAGGIGAILDLADAVDSTSLLIHRVGAFPLELIAASTAEFAFSRNQWPDSGLVALATLFRSREDTNAFRRTLAGERAVFLSWLQQDPASLASAMNLGGRASVTTGDSPSFFATVLGGLYVAILRPGDRIHGLDQFEHLMSGVPTEGPDSRAALQRFQQDIQAARWAWRWPLSTQMLPALASALEVEWRHLATLRCAWTACAVERFRGQNGRLPERLEELVPHFLDQIPDDPITGKPLQYRLQPVGYVVYSVGKDGTDDGGIEFARRPGNRDNGWDYTFTVER